MLNKKKNNGITMTTLVVTIIVMLIIAGVSIEIALGDNGLINSAINSQLSYRRAEEEDLIKTAVSSCMLKDAVSDTGITAEMLKKELEKLGVDPDKINIRENVTDPEKEGVLVVTIGGDGESPDNPYEVDQEGNVTAKDPINNKGEYKNTVNNTLAETNTSGEGGSGTGSGGSSGGTESRRKRKWNRK